MYYVLSVLPAKDRAAEAVGASVLVLFIDPGAFVFPILFTFQVANILRVKWRPMSISSGVFVALLLLLYFWHGVGIALINDEVTCHDAVGSAVGRVEGLRNPSPFVSAGFVAER